MKKFLCILVSLSMIFTLISDLPVFAEVTSLEGSGTSSDPYQVGSVEELQFMVTALNGTNAAYLNKYYVLTDDIDLSAIENFPVISNLGSSVLDGQGKKISNLKINFDYSSSSVPASSYWGFIKSINAGGAVKNIHFENANVKVTGSTSGTGHRLGTVVGRMTNGTISGVMVTGNVDGYDGIDGVGGIVGAVGDTGTTGIIRDCFFSGTVAARGHAGGIFGFSRVSNVENCIVVDSDIRTKNVGVSTTMCGMIGGITLNTSNITNCVAYSGSVNSDSVDNTRFLNRILGENRGTTPPCTLSGNLANEEITVDGQTVNGGTASDQNGADTILDDLKLQSTYENLDWDFENIWKMDVEKGYPVLEYRQVAPIITTEALIVGAVGNFYSQELDIAGDKPISLIISGGSLPSGLSLSGMTISGTPTTEGTANFLITASNSIGSDVKNFSINIVQGDGAAITTTSLLEGYVGGAYIQPLLAMGESPITWSVVNGALPNGLSLESDTGIISGTPTKADAFAFTVKAENSKGSDSKEFIIVISTKNVDSLMGNGTALNPYQVSSTDEFLFMVNALNGTNTSYLNKHYALTDDIDLSLLETSPVINKLEGSVLDGRGKKIINLKIRFDFTGDDVPSNSYYGFIKSIYGGGAVKNIVFENSDVRVLGSTGGSGHRLGTVVGRMTNGTISGVKVTGTVDGYDGVDGVGGIVGSIGDTSIQSVVNNCFFSGTVRARGHAGGIFGFSRMSSVVNCIVVNSDIHTKNSGTGISTTMCGMIGGVTLNTCYITNCVVYSGTVNCGNPDDNVRHFHRILGENRSKSAILYGNLANEDVIVIDSTISQGKSTDEDGASKTINDLQKPETYMNLLDWDFEKAWTWDNINKYPVPQYTPDFQQPPIYKVTGDGSVTNPYNISNEEDLLYFTNKFNLKVEEYIGKNYVLTNDIILNSNFPMIDEFSGVLEGKGYKISNLTINDTPESITGDYRAGFIRVLSGTVKNLAIEGASVTINGTSGESGQAVGILAGETLNGSSVIGCKVTGNVTAACCEKAGGIVGMTKSGALITDSFYSGNVTAKTIAGGISAYVQGTVQYCIAMGNISADDFAAFIAAYQNSAQIKNNAAYNGTVNGTNTGSIYANTGDSSGVTDNIASEGIVQSDKTAPGCVTIISFENMKEISAYKIIGWNFVDSWDWDSANLYPIPKYTATTAGVSCVTVSMNGDPSKQRGFVWNIPKLTSDFELGDVMLKLSKDKDFATVEQTLTTEPQALGDEMVCKVRADNLSPGSKYYYCIAFTVDGRVYVSDIGSFKTAPDSVEEFTFLNVSDTAASTVQKLGISAATLNKAYDFVPNVDFMMHNGDYVGNAEDEQNWSAFLEGAKTALMNTTLVPVAGDQDGTNGEFLNRFNLDAINGVSGPNGAYYSFDYSNTHFVVLNTNEADGLSQAQLDWIDSDVTAARAAGAEWVIVSLHKGAYLTGAHAQDSDVSNIRAKLVPLMDKLGIDLVIQGHDHLYARTKCLNVGSGTPDNPGIALEANYTEIWNGNRADYTYAGQGTFYFNAGTASDTKPRQTVSSDYITRYFERSAEVEKMWTTAPIQKFASVTVNSDRITVKVYQIYMDTDPKVVEGFGIDKAVSVLINKIDNLTDISSVQDARAVYNKMSLEQRAEIANYAKLLAKETELNIGATEENKWLSSDATDRQVISIRNDTKESFFDAPVLIKLDNIPSTNIEFYSKDGELLPHEIESLNQSGLTSVWVKVPEISAYSAEMIWIYYGNPAAEYNPPDVWNRHYRVVEHFNAPPVNGELTDSTGGKTGAVTGVLTPDTDTDSTNATYGMMSANFHNTKIQYFDVGDDYRELSLSAIVSVTRENLDNQASMFGGIISKRLDSSDSKNTANIAINKQNSRLRTEFYGSVMENVPSIKSNLSDTLFPIDGKPHLVTLSYDGMTISTYIDGILVNEASLEASPSLFTRDIPMTVGAYSNMDGVVSPFSGKIYEVQISSSRVSEWWEEFRYSNYFGDAVTLGIMETKASNTPYLIAEIPTKHTKNHKENVLEAGLIKVFGAVSRESILTCEYTDDDENIVTANCGTVSAGAFVKLVPINTIGNKTIKFKAISVADSNETAEYSLALTLQETVAPKIPSLKETLIGNKISVDVTPDTDDLKKVKAQLYVNESVALTNENVKVFDGSITETTPDAINPVLVAKGQELGDLTTITKVTNGQNPYQMFEITLTDQQQATDKFHLTWTGDVGGREATAYLYNSTANEWERIATAGGDGEISIDEVVGAVNYVKNDKMYLLILRALSIDPEERTRFIPDSSQYDATIFWDSDTQYEAMSYPNIFKERIKWVTENYADKKGVMQVSTGDLVNYPHLRYEYQWKMASDSYKMYEEAGVPFAMSWGNHDQDNQTNNRIMATKYYPFERFEANSGNWTLEGWYSDAPDKKTDSMYYTTEINGAKFLLLTINYIFESAQINWASRIISQHPDHFVIIATHYLTTTSSIVTSLVDPYPNVKLAIYGHVSGCSITYRNNSGAGSYLVMKEYQSLPFAGMGFFTMMNFDIENGFVYFNTLSLMDHQTTIDPTASPYADGKYSSSIPELYQYNRDEFAIKMDFMGGGEERELKTNSLTLSLDKPKKAEEISIYGSDTKRLTAVGSEIGAADGATYQWFVKLVDQADNSIATRPKLFKFGEDIYEPDLSVNINDVTVYDSTVTVPYTIGADVEDGTILSIIAFAVGETDDANTEYSGQPVAYHETFIYNAADTHTIIFTIPATSSESIAGADITRLLLIQLGGEGLDTAGKKIELNPTGGDSEGTLVLTATPGIEKITLSWTAAAAGATGVSLQISTDNTNWYLLASSPNASLSENLKDAFLFGSISYGATIAEVRGLKANITYYFKISVMGSGLDAKDHMVFATTVGHGGNQDGNLVLNATAGVEKVTLNWAAAGEGATTSELKISDNGSTWYALGVTPNPLLSENLKGAYLVGNISTGASTVDVRGLQANVTYYFNLTISGSGADAKDYIASAIPQAKTSDGNTGNNGTPINPPVWSGNASGGIGDSVNVSLPPITTPATDDLFTKDDMPSVMTESAKDEIMRDVPWAAPYISKLVQAGAIDGTAESFRPFDNITRAEFVKITVIIMGLQLDNNASADFSDMDPNAWYAPYVAAAVKSGIINGLDNGRFGAEEYISRQDIATIIYRAARDKIQLGNTDAFIDTADISEYAQEGVGALAKAGIINGIGDGYFAPTNNATRAEAAKMLAGIMKYM